MHDLNRALADITAIRTQIARGSVFRGLGPATLAATGLLALAVAFGQALWLDGASPEPLAFFVVWIVTAAIAAALIGVETVTRSRRMHSDLADEMIYSAIEQFLPAGATGALIGFVLASVDPHSVWMLPGLWQILVGLGLFAAARSLPHGLVLAGAWYVVAGLVVLALSAADKPLSPWLIGVPFAIGQPLVAALLLRASMGADDDEA